MKPGILKKKKNKDQNLRILLSMYCTNPDFIITHFFFFFFVHTRGKPDKERERVSQWQIIWKMSMTKKGE